MTVAPPADAAAIRGSGSAAFSARADRAIWALVVFAGVASTVAMPLGGLSLVISPALLQMLGFVLAFGVVAWLLRRHPQLYRFRTLALSIGQLFLLLILSKPLHYALMSTDLPLVDASLAAFDRWLGFDWQAYVAFIKGLPWLDRPIRLVYAHNFEHTALMLIVIGYAAGPSRLKETIGVAAISSLATMLICWLTPALGAHNFYQHPDAARVGYLTDLLAVRSGGMRTLDIAAATGLATFPSFHTVMALLFAWGALASRWIAVPVAIVEAGMLLAIPIYGSHYLADMLGGALLFAASLALWRCMVGAPRPDAAP